MKRVLRRVALLAILLLFPFTAGAISDQTRPALTRLWISVDEGDRFICTASYIQPYVNESISWTITAGHCAEGRLIKRSEAETVAGIVNWRLVVMDHGRYTLSVTDIAIGTVPEIRDGRTYAGREKLWLASENPSPGETVYIHGFPRGIEQVSLGQVVGASFLNDVKALVQTSDYDLEWKTYPELYPGTPLALLVPKGTIQGGSSGSPMLNQDGRLGGILWGIIPNNPYVMGIPDGYDLALFTPIERIHELLSALRIK